MIEVGYPREYIMLYVEQTKFKVIQQKYLGQNNVNRQGRLKEQFKKIKFTDAINCGEHVPAGINDTQTG
jgi:hypothetical protein